MREGFWEEDNSTIGETMFLAQKGKNKSHDSSIG
jgi:hypothetical protein